MKKKPWFITASILACVSSPIIMTYLQEGRSGEDALLVAFAWPLILLATLIVGLLLAFVAILRGEKPSRLAWGICFLNIPLTYYLLSETLYWRKDSIVPEIFLFGSIIILLSLKKWRALSKGIAVQRALNKWCATNNLELGSWKELPISSDPPNEVRRFQIRVTEKGPFIVATDLEVVLKKSDITGS